MVFSVCYCLVVAFWVDDNVSPVMMTCSDDAVVLRRWLDGETIYLFCVCAVRWILSQFSTISVASPDCHLLIGKSVSFQSIKKNCWRLYWRSHLFYSVLSFGASFQSRMLILKGKAVHMIWQYCFRSAIPFCICVAHWGLYRRSRLEKLPIKNLSST